mmetsp:Transcript_51887/g.121382  ORF Transcript_51887/g.121382 Transcript_51887/m.121382 type:complete len:137 (+) Transcript_51887:48-458(+)
MASQERKKLLSSRLSAKAASVNAFQSAPNRTGRRRLGSSGGSRSTFSISSPNLSKVHAEELSGAEVTKLPGETPAMHKSSSAPTLEAYVDTSTTSPPMPTRQQRRVMRREAFLAAASDAFASCDSRTRKYANWTLR